ncbi:Metalloendoproteinase 1 protein [Thalictrum thalictroides]|uniref:Metalloendoproteinase 1 protein n=1 Tax=Thalictrum thalictroides TaxID=46969 RepID=A0A7J6XEX8_THATH|nr:Metalloendoproteinase 1 protein [Thalictrum thalictroides]
MNSTLLCFLCFFSISSIFAHPFNNFPNIPDDIPNITFPASWDSFKNFSGCHVGDKVDGLANIKKYFRQFGYLPDSVDNYTDDFDDSLESALKIYQLNFNLNDTGVLDDTTLQQITLPRCGNADVVNGSSTMKSGSGKNNSHSDSSTIHSVAHYSFFPSRPRWPSWKTDLTYAFAPGNQLTDTVKSVFARAFLRWQDVTPLTFREIQNYDTADITIGFFGGNHGDGEPFDGVLGTLAHAFSPPDGRFHLDNAENWVVEGDVSTSSSNGAIDLESVAVHEIGHLLGLGHSSIPEAIMYPTISTGLKKVDLASDDVEGIQVLYGGNPNGAGSTGSTPRQERETNDGGVQFMGSCFKWALGLVIGGILLVL